MNHVPESDVFEVVEKIASYLPLINKNDLSVLTEILSELTRLSSDGNISVQLSSVAMRASRLTEAIILNDVQFESGCKRLKEAVAKMQYYLSNQGLENQGWEDIDNADVKKDEVIQPIDMERVVIPEENADLVAKFVVSLQSVLEDLEGKALSLENGSSEELSAIKRILHTMKGEFGVLNLQVYELLIHQVEAAIEANEFTSENLLRLKDLLGKKVLSYTDNSFPGISSDEFNHIFKLKGETKDNGCAGSSLQSGKKSEALTEPAGSQDTSLLSDFITESRDHIHNAECLLLELESNQGKPEHLNSIFRACHTIKGVACFLGLKDISTLAHAMENLMDLSRQKKIELNSCLIDLLLGAMDCLKEFVNTIENQVNGKPYKVPVNFQSVMEKLHKTVTENLNESESPKKLLGEILIEKGDVPEVVVEKALQMQKQGDERKIGQILIQENCVSEKKINDALALQRGNKAAKSFEDTIRVPVPRLDQLIDAIGEAVIAQSMLTADPAVKEASGQGLQTKINQANMIMRQIQQLSMSLRMVSVKSTFQKMARLVRDLSKRSGKQVNFIMEGEETEIDKTVVENIGDPLIHMIRNSMDHGIETDCERVKKGKPSIARIALKAYHKAGNVFIEVNDDGKGLDREAILNKAIERGMCKPGDKLSDQQIYDFIFSPGFSTASQITDISGRGVGMDVVKKNVEALRGNIEIHTEKDSGTTFTIRLPLTLAIIDGMVVKVSDAQYIIPTLSIIETIAAREEIIESVLNDQKMIKVRMNHLPLLYLSRLFEHKTNKTLQPVALIVEDALGKKAALLVDEIIGQQQVVIKNLGNGAISAPGISGGAIMSDGTVSLILDINGLIKNIKDN